MTTKLHKPRWGKWPLLFLVLLWHQSWSQMLAKANNLSQRQEKTTASAATQKLRQVLNELKSHYRVDVLFEGGSVEGFNVSADLIDFSLTLEQNLDRILPDGLSYKKVKNNSYLVLDTKKTKKTAEAGTRFQDEANGAPLKELTATNAPEKVAADQAVRGKVTDEKGAAMPGVSVVIKGTQKGTTTNGDGAFQIDVPNGNAVLVFSYVGYKSKDITVGNQSNITLALAPENLSLNEVVVTALGIKKQAKSIGYATASVGTDEMTINRTANFMNALQGKMAGVNITSLGSGPAGTSKIRIRGQSSFGGNNSPLIVVNGVPIDNTNNGARGDVARENYKLISPFLPRIAVHI
jgi:hypothetical protein